MIKKKERVESNLYSCHLTSSQCGWMVDAARGHVLAQPATPVTHLQSDQTHARGSLPGKKATPGFFFPKKEEKKTLSTTVPTSPRERALPAEEACRGNSFGLKMC